MDQNYYQLARSPAITSREFVSHQGITFKKHEDGIFTYQTKIKNKGYSPILVRTYRDEYSQTFGGEII